MTRFRVPRPSAAMIVALIALFVALGGTAYAAATIGSGQIIDESIKSQDIKNGEVKNADLGTDAVGSGKISDGQVKAADIANGAVTSDKLATAAAASVMNSSTESVPTATGTVLHANTEFFDTANLHDSGTNTESFVAPVSGTYVVPPRSSGTPAPPGIGGPRSSGRTARSHRPRGPRWPRRLHRAERQRDRGAGGRSDRARRGAAGQRRKPGRPDHPVRDRVRRPVARHPELRRPPGRSCRAASARCRPVARRRALAEHDDGHDHGDGRELRGADRGDTDGPRVAAAANAPKEIASTSPHSAIRRSTGRGSAANRGPRAPAAARRARSDGRR